MLYVAVPVQHSAIAFVRVALPLTDVRQQLRARAHGDADGARPRARGRRPRSRWICPTASASASGRLRESPPAIAAGDLTPPRLDYGDDELGAVARTLDDSVQELGRRLAELARDRGRMEAILAGMIEGVIVVDPQGRLQLVNRAARADAEARRRRRSAVTTSRPSGIRRSPSWWPRRLPARAPDALQLSPPRDPSRTLIARARRRPRSARPPTGAVLVLHDITDLQRADQIRRDFVANVSHELRTPLTAIRGYVEALSEGRDPEDSRRFLDIIMRHTLRMERLVKDLLRLARLDAGQETLELVSCDVRRPRSGGGRRCGAGARGRADSA